MVQASSLYIYNKVRYCFLKTPYLPVHQLYNIQTYRAQYLHRMQRDIPSGKFVHLQQGLVLIVKIEVAASTSTVQPWALSCTLSTLYEV